MKLKKLFISLLASVFLSGCVMNNGLCYEHIDADKDGICDVCHAKVTIKSDGKVEEEEKHDTTNDDVVPGNPCVTHVDHDLDGTCDVCGATMSSPAHDHIDGDSDGKCDICNASMIVCNSHYDNNGDGKCDNCGATMPPVTGDVTVYLVLSSVGLYKGSVGISYPSMNLEYAVAFTAAVGSALPGADDVTHVYQSATFTSWVAYEGQGAPTVYTKVPSVQNKILYAQFEANGQTPVTPTPGPDVPVSTETKDYTLKTGFSDGNWSDANAKICVYCWDDSGNNKLYTATRVDDQTYTFTILTFYTKLLFLRMSPDFTFNTQVWEGHWNQSEDIAIDSSKNTAQITCWNNNGSGKSGVTWIA